MESAENKYIVHHFNLSRHSFISNVIFEQWKAMNLQRSKIENLKIRIIFRTPWYKSFDEKICSEYKLNFLMTEKKQNFRIRNPLSNLRVKIMVYP